MGLGHRPRGGQCRCAASLSGARLGCIVNFTLSDAVPVLRRTPAVLRAWLGDLPDSWTTSNEGPDTWSPYDIVGHLIHGERTDWIPRTELLLAHGESRPFTPFDRFAQSRESRGKSLRELLDTFTDLRAQNVVRLESLQLTPADLERRGRHPELGPVTLGQLLATWVAHDLNHLGQMARVMGRQYTGAVGPWLAYLPMLGTPRRTAAPSDRKDSRGSVASAMNWMGCLTLLLFWLPVVGPFIAGLVGGVKAGSVTGALLAVFVPGVMTGLMVAVGVAYLTDFWPWGVLAGLGGIAISFLNIGPLLLGAVLGGLGSGLGGRGRPD